DGSYQISPFTPNMKWDITVTPKIESFSCDELYCSLNEDVLKTVDPSSMQAVREGTRLAVTDPAFGTLHDLFNDFPIAVAGKTGTAEYCDDVARAADRCAFGAWPTHSWTIAYAPYDDPEIVILAFGTIGMFMTIYSLPNKNTNIMIYQVFRYCKFFAIKFSFRLA
ncbi:MAG TPA: penicillin-binding transpeptidase domain-containing protein, partial [Trichococcus flocculiformis]|nr:penicillin-binding transpeptidase domain-containing protein [Trichococcus flocculiformis]